MSVVIYLAVGAVIALRMRVVWRDTYGDPMPWWVEGAYLLLWPATLAYDVIVTAWRGFRGTGAR